MAGPSLCKRDDSLITTKVDPLLKSLHSDPRFAAFLKKLNSADVKNVVLFYKSNFWEAGASSSRDRPETIFVDFE